ncbi:MAG: N-acetylmuramoyl-L-alanine amidase [Desulfobacteraceae bacterium]|nr:MAG: N-acetylmuramoyl-L-alanine amidase [Desulfobacteraceae bacterium]
MMMIETKKTALVISFFCSVLLFCTTAVAEKSPKTRYYQAESTFKQLLGDQKKQQYRRNWLQCIQQYQEVYILDPSGPWAAAGMYKTGVLYAKLSKWSNKEEDRKEAIDIFKKIINQYPGSRYKAKAADEISRIAGNSPATKADKTYHKEKNTALLPKKNDTPPKPLIQPEIQLAAKEITPITFPKNFSTIKDLRFWSNPNYTRIVIDADKDTTFTHHLLKKDPSISKPQRLYVDLNQSRLGKTFEKTKQINDDLLKDARAGQYTTDTVRVVIDIKSFKNYKIFSLKNPFRIVIDVWGKDGQPVQYAKKSIPDNGYHSPSGSKISPSAIAKQLALGVRTIVIDPGHGGHDYGAPGYIKGTHEKDIVLNLAKKLARKIKDTVDCNVILTRETDIFLTLEERTAIANTKNADLFISIHTNASRDHRAYGIETYFLNLATDDESIRVAAKENATSTKNISDLQSILIDLMQNAKINESSRLATHVQDSMYHTLKGQYNQIKSKGVKQAPFYVLLGAQMPAILVETAFISNPTECKRLSNSTYQERLCDSIVHGIRKYIKETNPTAFNRKNPDEPS